MTDYDANNANEMLSCARDNLAQWRSSGEGTAAERHAARRLAWAFGRLDDLATAGRYGRRTLPAAWGQASILTPGSMPTLEDGTPDLSAPPAGYDQETGLTHTQGPECKACAADLRDVARYAEALAAGATSLLAARPDDPSTWPTHARTTPGRPCTGPGCDHISHRQHPGAVAGHE